MSRHRHVGRMVKGALEEYDEDDDEYYEEEDEQDTASSSSSHDPYVYNRSNQQQHSVAHFTSKPAKAKPVTAKPAASKPAAALPPPHPVHTSTTTAAHTTASATAAHSRTPSIPPGFSAGDYADDDYIPLDEEHEQWEEGEEEQWEDGDDEYDEYDSAVTYKQPATVAPKPKQVAKATPVKKGKLAVASSSPARSPSPLTATASPKPAATPPPAARLRTAAEEAETAAAVNALRLEKIKLSNSPSMPRLSSASSQAEPSLIRSYSPAPSTPTSASASSSSMPSSSPGIPILRTSSSTEQLALVAQHKRQQSRMALVEAEDKKETSKPTLNVVAIGHVDAGKCFARGTRVRLYNGDTIAVEDVRQRMHDIAASNIANNTNHTLQLMGDDGLPRTVDPASLTQGNDILYRITPIKYSGGLPFIVNGAHILVLTMNVRPFKAVRDAEAGIFKVKWWELSTDNVMRLRSKNVTGERAADAEVNEMRQGWQPLEWEVSVEEFLDSSTSAQSDSKLVACRAITFSNPLLPSLRDVLTTVLRAPPSPAQLEYIAWWLGIWLTDGWSDRATISQGGEPHPRPYNHKAVMDRVRLVYRQLFNEPVDKVFNKVSTAGWDVWNFKYGAGSVADRVLRQYRLLNNKRIPRALICDSLDVRRRLLAGIIDGDGWYCADKNYYEISAQHRVSIDGLKELAATLGLRNCPVQEREVTNQQTGDTYPGHCINISGDMWDAVQHCVLTYKQCPAPGSEDWTDPQKDSRCHGFKVVPLPGTGDYFGFAVDGNQRFLLEDYTITHNVSHQPARAIRAPRLPHTHFD